MSDFIINSGDVSFPCHKAILANMSDVFMTMFRSKEWDKEDMAIDDFDPATVQLMLKFIYTGRIDDDEKCTTSYVLRLLFNIFFLTIC